MTLPAWDEFMLPLLQVMSDGQERGARELRAATAARVGLTEEQLAEELPSGQGKAANRIGWAASYLTRVGALNRPRRGRYVITDLGQQMAQQHPGGISRKELRSYAPATDQWWLARRTTSTSITAEDSEPDTSLDPIEQIEQGVSRVHQDVAARLMQRLLDNEPEFFERAVVVLLEAMGYGGTEGGGHVTPRSGDEGIDGIIDQDALGLSRIYLQAKRYAPERTVGRPDLQAFVGALSGKADGGVFLTTARFSGDAKAYAASVPARLILIDGARLTELMIRYGVGVQEQRVYRIVDIDEDFFE